jgi:gamma-glutamyltranspeptidase/glutathione hydrolase
MVASPHHLASRAGLEVLRRGGSAVDACIAMNATLAVVYPHMAGLGGDLFAQVWDPKEHAVRALNASGRAGGQVTIEAYRSRGHRSIPERGPLAASTVPGAVDGWARLHDRFGRLDWQALFADAIRHAEIGFPITAKLSQAAADAWATFAPDGPAAALHRPGGQPLASGATLRQPDLARSLRLIADHGADTFYRGELAELIVEGLRHAGGLLSGEDFADHRSDWVEPITTGYGPYQVSQLPPNTQGIAVLLILNLIARYDLAGMGDPSADAIHLVVEATKLAYADRDRWVADPASVQVPFETLLSSDYAARRAALIDPRRARPEGEASPGAEGGDTVYLCAVDAEGMACSLIESIYFAFGSGFMPPGTGILLHDRACLFTLDPEHPNALGPGKRPFHTLIPAMALRDGRPELLFGTMGGDGQPQTQVAILTRIVHHGHDPQAAIEAPRWLYGRTWGEASKSLKLEGRIPDAVVDELRRRGHEVQVVEAWSERMGHAQAIRIDAESGALQGGADPRGDGVALGW